MNDIWIIVWHAVNDHLSEIKNQKIQLSNIKLKMSENTAVSFLKNLSGHLELAPIKC